MISGAHVMLFSTDAEADRAFFRDVLQLPQVDAGDGWLIFSLPPTEVAVHPGRKNGRHELFLTCDDLTATVRRLRSQKIRCSAPVDRGWGILAMVRLPGGGEIGLYEPRHARPPRKRRGARPASRAPARSTGSEDERAFGEPRASGGAVGEDR
jgi:catechol 2,3-dioxygenase-like lactoylglutathione lyase family enzyme